MIDIPAVREILAAYKKHDWLLRRVLLCEASANLIASGSIDLFSETEVKRADFDAAWFSRAPRPGCVAWELRSLGHRPFALVERADENSPEFESVLAEAEQRLAHAVAGKIGLTTVPPDSKLDVLT